MSSLHIICMLQPGTLQVGASARALQPGLWLMVGAAPPPPLPACGRVYSTCGTHLQSVFHDVQHLLAQGAPGVAFARDEPHAVRAEPGLLQVVVRLAEIDPEAMWRFALAYCLVADGPSCSALLRPLVAADFALFDFLHRHRLEPWPVARYADVLELPLRKFTQLFKEKYGTSPKHWLQTQRLEHAHRLLQTTRKKVIEIALESGFCSAAHFSESFRRHFRVSPRDARQQARQQSAALVSTLQELFMDLASIADALSAQLSRSEAALSQAIDSTSGSSDPSSMLKLQYAMQDMSITYSAASTSSKAVKDMISGIVHNMT
ncbi:Virulence regulon transcriptional activator VirF [Pandoraea sputorum]|nr:Virulence regulon transcriptional activator VirF [Pandoraea sputorum]